MVRLGFLTVMIIGCTMVASANDAVQRLAISGTAGYGKDTFKFKSAIAKWKSAEKTLELGLFPFDVTDEDADKVLKYRMMFYATVGKPSPDESKWKTAPYLVIELKVEGDKTDYTQADVVSGGLNAVKVKGESTTGVFLSKEMTASIVKKLALKPADLKSLKFHLKETKDQSMMKGFRYEAKTGK